MSYSNIKINGIWQHKNYISIIKNYSDMNTFIDIVDNSIIYSKYRKLIITYKFKNKKVTYYGKLSPNGQSIRWKNIRNGRISYWRKVDNKQIIKIQSFYRGYKARIIINYLKKFNNEFKCKYCQNR